MLDVLTFYQERIANEGYLRTATERRSMLELARAIGYELSPGVAASTYWPSPWRRAGSPPSAVIAPAPRCRASPGRTSCRRSSRPSRRSRPAPTGTRLRLRSWKTMRFVSNGEKRLNVRAPGSCSRRGDAQVVVSQERTRDPRKATGTCGAS